jgi:hypothetical protein
LEQDEAKLELFYYHGYDTMERKMDELKEFLEN